MDAVGELEPAEGCGVLGRIFVRSGEVVYADAAVEVVDDDGVPGVEDVEGRVGNEGVMHLKAIVRYAIER